VKTFQFSGGWKKEGEKYYSGRIQFQETKSVIQEGKILTEREGAGVIKRKERRR